MAVKFEFVNTVICEKVLTEVDGITSAIRIVDLFFIPENAPETFVIQFTVIIALRAFITSPEEFRVGITLIGPTGNRQRLPDPPEQPYKLSIFENDPSVPSGFTLIIGCAVKPTKLGTCYLEVEVNGEAITKIPFTLRRVPAEQNT